MICLSKFFAIGPGYKYHTVFDGFSVDVKLPCLILNQSCFTEKIPHFTPKTFVICVSKFFAIGPGLKDHVVFHGFSADVKLPCVILNQSRYTEKIPHFTPKTLSDLCEQVFAIGPGFKDHMAFHQISVNVKFSCAILN